MKNVKKETMDILFMASSPNPRSKICPESFDSAQNKFRRRSANLKSSDHLIRLVQNRLRKCEADLLRRLKIDYQFKLRRLLDGEVARFGTFEDLVYVVSAAADQVVYARPIRYEPTEFHKFRSAEHRGQPVLCGEVDEASSLKKEHRARKHDEGIGVFSGDRRECAVELVGTPHFHELKSQSQSPGRSLCLLQHVSRRALAKSAGMPERGDTGNSRKGFL